VGVALIGALFIKKYMGSFLSRCSVSGEPSSPKCSHNSEYIHLARSVALEITHAAAELTFECRVCHKKSRYTFEFGVGGLRVSNQYQPVVFWIYNAADNLNVTFYQAASLARQIGSKNYNLFTFNCFSFAEDFYNGLVRLHESDVLLNALET
jgi:hypothetical protein